MRHFINTHIKGDLGFAIIALVTIAITQVLNVESADITMDHFFGTIVVGIYPSTIEVQVIVATMRRLDYWTALALLAHAYAVSFIVHPPEYLLNATIGSKAADVILVALLYWAFKKFWPNLSAIPAFFIASTLALINDAFWFGLIGTWEGCDCFAPFWADIWTRLLMQGATAALFMLFFFSKDNNVKNEKDKHPLPVLDGNEVK